MGILEDAIHNHLELKRKHGASEDEVKKLEEEALGTGGEFSSPPIAAPVGSQVSPVPVEERVEETIEPEDVAPQEEPAQEGAAPEDDILEETPEFLEKTPDQDQLWFEQKPPKDFDF